MGMSREHGDEVGRQLRQRREDLGLTQQDVAKALGITTRTIQLAEHGRTTIRLGKREAWEQILYLQRGAISRAYRDGAPLETIDIVGVPELGPEEWSDFEWFVYSEPDIDEDARRRLVDTYREAKGRPPRRDWTAPPDAQSRNRLA